MVKFLGLSLNLSNHNCRNALKIVVKYEYLQSWEISNNVALLEFGLAKSDLRLLSLPKVNFKEDFLNIFHFTLPLIQALFKIWINNKLYLSSLLHNQWYFIILSLMKRFEIVVGANLRKNLKSLMPKQSDGSCLQEHQEQ